MAAWTRGGPLAQAAVAVLLCAEGGAGALQTRQGPEGPEAFNGTGALAFGEWPGRRADPRGGNRTGKRAARRGPWRGGGRRARRRLKLRSGCDEILGRDAGGRTVCGPQVIIGGAMKCGTNELGSLLALHPRVKLHYCREQECQKCGSECDEMFQGAQFSGQQVLWESHYFTYGTTYREPPRDYQGDVARHVLARQLPRTDGVHNITLDKSPSYLDTHIFPDVVAHATRMLPHAKIIFALCDPAARLYAEYYHSKKWDNRTLVGSFQDAQVEPPASFAEWVAALQEGSEFCRLHEDHCQSARKNYLMKGLYAKNLRQWLDAFGREAVLVLNPVDRRTTGEKEVQLQVARLLAHVGLPLEEYPWGALKNKAGAKFANHDYNGRAYASTEAPEAMRMLREFYRGHNAQLAELLHESWPLDW